MAEQTYVAMWNLPGCLPEMEPMQFDTPEEAREALLEEVNRCREHAEDVGPSNDPDDDNATKWHEMWHSIKNAPKHDLCNNWMGPDGYAYSIDVASQ